MAQAKESVPPLRQVTELNQAEKWEQCLNDSAASVRPFSQKQKKKKEKHCRGWPTGKVDSGVTLLIQDNDKPH